MPLYQCVVLLDNLASQPLDVGDAAARGGAGGPSHKLQELKLHAHLPCLHAELGKRCIATCPATCGPRARLGPYRLVLRNLVVSVVVCPEA